jgi:hypothetical protein
LVSNVLCKKTPNSARKELTYVENLLFQWALMFGLPMMGALIIRARPGVWWSWLIWAALCFCSYAVMHGAGWSIAHASWAIIGFSLFGGFVDVIVPSVARNVNAGTIRIVAIPALIIGAIFWFNQATEVQRQWAVVFVVLAIVVGFGGRGGGGR